MQIWVEEDMKALCSVAFSKLKLATNLKRVSKSIISDWKLGQIIAVFRCFCLVYIKPFLTFLLSNLSLSSLSICRLAGSLQYFDTKCSYIGRCRKVIEGLSTDGLEGLRFRVENDPFHASGEITVALMAARHLLLLCKIELGKRCVETLMLCRNKNIEHALWSELLEQWIVGGELVALE